MKNYLMLFAGLFTSLIYAQDIKMEFPYLKGKTYDFIIFQGDTPITVVQDTITANGIFTLKVPQQYRPYTGMCRWLITNTMEGGGLDMIIPGKDFSVSCKVPQPDNNSIIYVNNNGPETLNRLYAEQQGIYNKYFAMEQAMKAYPEKDKAHSFFKSEYDKQVTAYDVFQKRISKEAPYVWQFLTIVNITQGMGTRLGINETEKARNITSYITNQLDWEILYTSGHWGGIISAWVDIHTEVLKDEKLMEQELAIINKKLVKAERKTAFNDKITYFKNRKKEGQQY